ncbi:DUF1768-domain-containing protein [Mycena leptocephala]|nr:DUF1768-domain-containing protein [Mycena leptocephala]
MSYPLALSPHTQADLCTNCHSSAKRWNNANNTFHPYCSKTCAIQALGQTAGSNGTGTVGQTQDNCDTTNASLSIATLIRRDGTRIAALSIHTAQKPVPMRLLAAPAMRHKRRAHSIRIVRGLALIKLSAARQALTAPIAPHRWAAVMHCHSYPKRWDSKSQTFHLYCSRTCATQALLWGGPSPAQAQARPRILFYHRNDLYYGFTNFSPHPVQYNGKEYRTSEHLFQAFKEYLRRNQFLDNRPDIAEKIRTISNSPWDAFNEARVHKADQHPDWLKMKMNIAKDSAEDRFWGIGKDGQGQNELGKALEKLRSKLQAAS